MPTKIWTAAKRFPDFGIQKAVFLFILGLMDNILIIYSSEII